MTFKELLNSVNFEDVAPHIVRMYPEMKDCLGWFNLHFDILRQMKPIHHLNANSDVCNISMKDWEDGTGLHLNAFPMEGDLWEHSLTKELIIAPNVKACNEELAACCLWHTSFYGFTYGKVEESLHIGEECNQLVSIPDMRHYRNAARQSFSQIRRYGGSIPSMRELSPSKRKELIRKAKSIYWNKHRKARLNRPKRKRIIRQAFLEKYYERMQNISQFILKVAPHLSHINNYVKISHLCRLFNSERFGITTIESVAEKNKDSATYLKELIAKYDMLPKAQNHIIYIARGYDYDLELDDGITHEALRPTEYELMNTICERLGEDEIGGTIDLIIGVEPELGYQTLLTIVSYYADKPITYDINET